MLHAYESPCWFGDETIINKNKTKIKEIMKEKERKKPLVVLINEETTKSAERAAATVIAIETDPDCEIHVKRDPQLNEQILNIIESKHTGKLVVIDATAVC